MNLVSGYKIASPALLPVSLEMNLQAGEWMKKEMAGKGVNNEINGRMKDRMRDECNK